MTFTFRDATVEDAEIVNRLVDVVQALHAEALPKVFRPADGAGFPVKAMARHMKGAGNFVALCFVGDEGAGNEPAGFIGVRVIRQRQDGLHFAHKTFMLDQIAVHPAFRRQGVGRALMDHFRERARADKADRVALEVWDFNSEAQAFFAACGFAPAKHMLWRKP